MKGKTDKLEAVFTHNAQTPGLHRGRIIFATQRFQRPVITIPVFSRVYDPVEAVPTRLNFGSVPLKKFDTQTDLPVKSLYLKCHTHDTFALTRVWVDGSGFNAGPPEAVAAGGYRINVFFTGGKNREPGRLAAELILETTVKGFERIAVPLAGERI